MTPIAKKAVQIEQINSQVCANYVSELANGWTYSQEHEVIEIFKINIGCMINIYLTTDRWFER